MSDYYDTENGVFGGFVFGYPFRKSSVRYTGL